MRIYLEICTAINRLDKKVKRKKIPRNITFAPKI